MSAPIVYVLVFTSFRGLSSPTQQCDGIDTVKSHTNDCCFIQQEMGMVNMQLELRFEAHQYLHFTIIHRLYDPAERDTASQLIIAYSNTYLIFKICWPYLYSLAVPRDSMRSSRSSSSSYGGDMESDLIRDYFKQTLVIPRTSYASNASSNASRTKRSPISRRIKR